MKGSKGLKVRSELKLGRKVNVALLWLERMG